MSEVFQDLGCDFLHVCVNRHFVRVKVFLHD